MNITIPAAVAASLLAVIAIAVPASANVTNPADNPHKITVTGDDGRTYVDGQDTLPGYDDEECTYIPGAWFDFDNNRVHYADGQSIPWSEWDRATGYKEWLAKKEAAKPAATTAPAKPAATSAPAKPAAISAPAKPAESAPATTAPAKPSGSTSGSTSNTGSTSGQLSNSQTSGGTVASAQGTATGGSSPATSGGSSTKPGTTKPAPQGSQDASQGADAVSEEAAEPTVTAYAADEDVSETEVTESTEEAVAVAAGSDGSGGQAGAGSGSAAGLAILGSLFGALGLAFGAYALFKRGPAPRVTPQP